MTDQAVHDLMRNIWDQYQKLCPTALEVYSLLEKNNEEVINDHIALRTLRHPLAGIEKLAKTFLSMGYEEGGEYHFEAKKLYAKHYQHSDPDLPKVFISELKLEELESEVSSILSSSIEYHKDRDADADYVYSGRSWPISHETYKTLYQTSEFAAWFYCHGFMPNHFTVYLNRLSQFESIAQLNDWLEQNSFKLNHHGGAIKGGEDVMLEQSSIMADNVDVEFSEGSFAVPGCYLEFAKRFPDSKVGGLYQGFVAKSADKIFESTHQS